MKQYTKVIRKDNPNIFEVLPDLKVSSVMFNSRFHGFPNKNDPYQKYPKINEHTEAAMIDIQLTYSIKK
jgi:hypothetical protein